MDKAFLKFDKDCNGYLDAADLKYSSRFINDIEEYSTARFILRLRAEKRPKIKFLWSF